MNEGIFKITKDIERARELLSMAKERITDIISILPKDKAYKILEEYYEVIVQAITAIMYGDGYKTLDHISLIKYIEDNYKEFDNLQISLIDKMRKLRHGAVYYGKKVNEEFLINNEDEIKKIISLLIKIAEKKSKKF